MPPDPPHPPTHTRTHAHTLLHTTATSPSPIGRAQADAALLVVPASPGDFEAGFGDGGQTKEHAILARSLGVSQIVVVVNKLDTVRRGWR